MRLELLHYVAGDESEEEVAVLLGGELGALCDREVLARDFFAKVAEIGGAEAGEKLECDGRDDSNVAGQRADGEEGDDEDEGGGGGDSDGSGELVAKDAW